VDPVDGESRRCSFARLMNSPRSRARVVAGGESMALVTASSVTMRSTAFGLEQIEDSAAAVHVVVLKVEQCHPWDCPREAGGASR